MSQTPTLELPPADVIDSSKWDKFIFWAGKFRSLPDFDKLERTPKLEIARNVRAARDAFLAGSTDWHDALKKAFGKPNFLMHHIPQSRFLDWCKENPEGATSALTALWTTNGSIVEQLAAFLHLLPKEGGSGPSARIGIGSYLLLADNPNDVAFYRSRPFAKCFDLVGWPHPQRESLDSERYGHALVFLDTMIEEGSKRDLPIRDRLDAQSLVWTVTRWGPGETWSADEQAALRRYRGWKPKEDDDDQNESMKADSESDEHSQSSSQEPLASLDSLAASLMLPVEHLHKIEALLDYKRQAIFYGPPGTGKTFVAREIAGYFARDGGEVNIVQFHPSYAYEDFIEGLRPVEVDGETRFRVVDGPLKRIAEQARQTPDATHVLLIDEINRGNLSKVLGELYFLLEYRDEAIRLQYSAEGFALPDNLWIIGTMNTADRSIALVDAALRRRFFFVGFFPDKEPIEGLLRRWLARENPDMLWVADIVDEANRRLGDRHLAIGPSYFMKPDLDEEWLEIIWEHQVIPYIAEQFFGEEERLDEFQLRNLRRQPAVVVDETPDPDAE